MSFLNFSVSAIVVFGLPLYYKVLTLYSQGARGHLAIGMTGFEPAASASQRRRSTKLTHNHTSEVVVPIAANFRTYQREVTAVKRGGGGWSPLDLQSITLFVVLVKGFPVFPSILVNQMHSQNRNEH